MVVAFSVVESSKFFNAVPVASKEVVAEAKRMSFAEVEAAMAEMGYSVYDPF